MSKKVILTFEKEEDYEIFVKEIKKIPQKVGYIESENKESLNIKVVDLEAK